MSVRKRASNPRCHLGPTHPVAEVAARRCAESHALPPGSRLGRVACGACWERAIRDDERAVIEFEVPREIEPDPAYVDEIAVERACQGEQLPLTPAEQAEAVRRLVAAGADHEEAGRRLGLNAAANVAADMADAKPAEEAA